MTGVACLHGRRRITCRSVGPDEKQSQGTAVGRNVPPPKDAHILVLKSRDYVTLRGKRDFADVITLRILK